MVPTDPLPPKVLYEFGPFRVDPDRALLLRDDGPVPLTPKAFQILLAMLRHPREVVSKDELLKAVWPDTFVEEGNLSRNVFLLRKALGETATDRYIVTIPGRGYRLAGPVRTVSEPAVDITVATHASTRVEVEVTRPSSRLWFSAAAALVVVAGVVAAATLRPQRQRLTARDTVVLAEFSNATGDAVFDDTLRQAMAVELDESPLLRLVPEQRIQRTLQLMGKPAETPLRGATAREACERVGAAAVVEGSISSLGSQYVLGLVARNCRSGEVLDQEQVQAARKEDVLLALAGVARTFRTRAGESLASVEQHSTPLDEATTTSLDAWREYTAGWKVHATRGASASAPLFERAVELDPGFAMAHASLGRAYADLDQPDRAAASTRRAWELRDRISGPERFAVTANYQMLVTGNMELAQQTCEAWARAYPRDPRPHVMLGGPVHKTAGRFEHALAETRRAIELDPDFAIAYYSVGVNSLYLGRAADAARALQDAAARGLDIDEFVMLAYDLAFVTGDTAGLEREAARAKARAGGENWMSAREALVAAYSGHLREARRLSATAVAQAKQAGQPERASLWEAGAAVREALMGNLAAGSERAAAALALSRNREAEYGAAVALSLAGDVARAQALADDLLARFGEDSSVQFSFIPVIRAELALARHDPARALQQLEVASPHELGVPRSSLSALFGALYPVYVRGQADLALGRNAEAAAEFQKILDHPGIVVDDPVGALARLGLARAYAASGDTTRAKAAYHGFLALWSGADADVPVFAAAQAEAARLH